MNKIYIFIIISIIIISKSHLALPIDGVLDPSFNGNGKVTTQFPLNAEALSVTIQSDGKIIAVGWFSDSNENNFVLARYSIDGSLDNNFGNGGVVFTNSPYYSLIYDTIIQSNNKIVATGEITTPATFITAR